MIQEMAAESSRRRKGIGGREKFAAVIRRVAAGIQKEEEDNARKGGRGAGSKGGIGREAVGIGLGDRKEPNPTHPPPSPSRIQPETTSSQLLRDLGIVGTEWDSFWNVSDPNASNPNGISGWWGLPPEPGEELQQQPFANDRWGLLG